MEEWTADSTAANADTLKRELEKIVREIVYGEIKDCGETDGIFGVPRAIDEAIRILNRLRIVDSKKPEPDIPSPSWSVEVPTNFSLETEMVVSSGKMQATDSSSPTDLLSMETETVVSSGKVADIDCWGNPKTYHNEGLDNVQKESAAIGEKIHHLEESIKTVNKKIGEQAVLNDLSIHEVRRVLEKEIQTKVAQIDVDLNLLVNTQKDTFVKNFSTLEDKMNLNFQKISNSVDQIKIDLKKFKEANALMQTKVRAIEENIGSFESRLKKLERQQTENKKDCDSKMTEIKGMITQKK